MRTFLALWLLLDLASVLWLLREFRHAVEMPDVED